MNSRPQPPRTVVMGSSGFIGAHLVAELERRRLPFVACTFPEIDLTDSAQVQHIMDEYSPQRVFHLAAGGVQSGDADDVQQLEANIAMTANLVGAAPPHTVLVIAGSMAEYGQSGVLREDAACRPRTAYAIGKFAASAYALAYARSRSVTVRVGRLFGVYGPGESAGRLFPTLLRNLPAGLSVDLSDGAQQRDFVHVSDAVSTLIRLSDLPAGAPSVLNIGTGRAVRVADACRWIADGLDADRSLLRFGARERSPGDADLLVADVTRLRASVGSVPHQHIRAGLDLHGLFGHEVPPPTL